MPTPTHLWTRSRLDELAVAAGCTFDPAAAERVRTFFAKGLKHSKGQHAGQAFELLPWQWEHIIAPLFGWKRADGTRRYRRASIWVPKKNGKSTLCSGLVLYGLVGDQESGAHVFGAAVDRQQSSIIFEECAQMVRQAPALAKRLQILDSTKRILYREKASFYTVLSKEAKKTGHGINASMAVIDELHVVDRDLYDTLRYAGAARRQPLMIEISTAGNDKSSLGYERYLYAKRLLAGEFEDLETLAYIAEADSNDVWQEPEQWHKANPSLGHTITLDSFQADFNEAKEGSPLTQANFKQLRLNLWQDTIFAWLPLEVWDACAETIDWSAFEGEPCWAGLDIGSTNDLTSLALLFRRQEDYYLRLFFWCPAAADGRRRKQDKALLKPWIEAGLIRTTSGNYINPDQVEKDILEILAPYHLNDMGFDDWNAKSTYTHLDAAGLTLVNFPQTLKNYTEPVKEIERLVGEKKLHHDGNLCMRWQMGNVMMYKDTNGNSRPHKGKSRDHIDGVTATLMALGRCIASPGGSVYEQGGVFWLE